MNVRDANPTLEDWKLLMTCTNRSLDSSTKEPFDKEIHMFAINEDVKNHNKLCLQKHNKGYLQNLNLDIEQILCDSAQLELA